MEPIITCLGQDLANAYIETSNAPLVEMAASPLIGASGVGFVNGVSLTAVTSPYSIPTTTAAVGALTSGAIPFAASATPAPVVRSDTIRNEIGMIGVSVLAGLFAAMVM